MAGNQGALIVGAGDGLSASLARLFAREGWRVTLAARRIEKLARLCQETGAVAHVCDVAERDQVTALFKWLDQAFGAPALVVYNPSFRTRGPLVELEAGDVAKSLAITAYGGFLVGQQAARRMLKAGGGAILFTGASASVKGYANSAPFAMGKFALRGLAQSMARELQPSNIHVAHFVIDGAIANPGVLRPKDEEDSLLDPDAIARTYLDVVRQHRSAWTWEVELRPWVETF